MEGTEEGEATGKGRRAEIEGRGIGWKRRKVEGE